MKVLNFVHESCVQPVGVCPTISSLLFEHAAEVNISDPALSALPASLCCFSCVGVCVLAKSSCWAADGEKGQRGSAVAQCSVSQFLVANEEWAAQEEEEEADEEE